VLSVAGTDVVPLDATQAISHQGLVLRLLQKEKDLVQLRIDLDQLGKKTAREGSEAASLAGSSPILRLC
jgi:hypothetical protein